MSQNLIVAKFGGTSVADYTAMNRSADVVLSNPDVRLVVLSASAGVTNLLVALAEGQQQEQRTALLDEIRRIQYAIINPLNHPGVIREEIDRILDNISTLSDAAALATSTALTDELVGHGELMSTLLFVEVLRQRNVAAEWFDVRKVMRTNDRFGRAEPESTALTELVNSQLKPRTAEALIVTQGFIGCEAQGRTTTLGRGGSDYTAALLGRRYTPAALISGPMYRAFTLPTHAWSPLPSVSTRSLLKKPLKWRPSVRRCFTRPPCCLRCAAIFQCLSAPVKIRPPGTIVCNETRHPPLFRALALRRKQTLLTLHSLNMLHARGFLAEVFNILARHSISVDLITTSEVSVALTLDTTGSTSTSDSLLTQALLTELSSLCRVEVEENLALVAIIGNQLSKACGVGKEVFGVLEPFNLRMICYGASSYNLCFLVPGNDAEKIVQTLHRNIFE